MIAINAFQGFCAVLGLLVQQGSLPAPAISEEAVRFIENEIAGIRQVVSSNSRRYMVVSHVLSPGLSADAATEIMTGLGQRDLTGEIVALLERRMGIHAHPAESRTDTVFAEILPEGGQAMLLQEGSQPELWAEWNKAVNYRMDFFPRTLTGAADSLDKIQVHPFENSAYDPQLVLIEDLRELLDWGYTSVMAGNGQWIIEGGVQTLRIQWTKSEKQPNPIRLGLHLAFSSIGQDVVWTLRRTTNEQSGQISTHLVVLQSDANNALLRSEIFEWRPSWPATISWQKVEYFPGGHYVKRSESRILIPQTAEQIGMIQSMMPTREGAKVLDWRIDGKLGEYYFQGSLPRLKELQQIIAEAKH